MTNCSIYRITNHLSGKSYIGVSNTPQRRFKEHCASREIIGKAIRKYGKENFSLHILAIGSKDYCYSIETQCIKLYSTRIPNGYNVSFGGDRGPDNNGRKHNSETIKKMSAAHKGKKRTPFSDELKARMRLNLEIARAKRTKESFLKQIETKKKNQKPQKPITEETREKLRKARAGKSSWNKGIPATEEHKQKLRLASPKKRNPHSDETKRRIGEKSKGRFFSEESRKKMSESRKTFLSKKETEK